MSALGGALFAFNVGFMSPKLVTIEPSIYMVSSARGGRNSLVERCMDHSVTYGRTYFSEQFPALCISDGGVFILVTRYFPLAWPGSRKMLVRSSSGYLTRRPGAKVPHTECGRFHIHASFRKNLTLLTHENPNQWVFYGGPFFFCAAKLRKA